MRNAYEPHAEPTGIPIHTQTQSHTHSQGYVPFATQTGAAAPSEEKATNAGDVVAEYVKVRTSAGLFTAKPHRAILGRYAREVLTTGLWDGPTLLAAIREFAVTKRHPRFVAEWCSQYITEREIDAHEARKKEEKPQVKVEKSMRRLDVMSVLERIEAGS